MRSRELNRELNYLLSTTTIPLTTPYFSNGLDVSKEIAKSNQCPKHFKEKHKKLIRIFELSNILGLSDNELFIKWQALLAMRKKYADDYKLRPIREGRDNKGVYVGRGGDNGNKVRYPSKKRSKRVWRIFYEMFPYYAIKDGWDGEISIRMK